MKILYVITRANQGGAQTNVLALARQSRRAGHDVAVGVGESGWLTDSLRGTGVRTLVLPRLRRTWNPASVPQMIPSLRRLIETERPDVLHMHSSNALFAALAAKSVSRPPFTVATVHGLSVLHPGWRGNPAKRLTFAASMRFLWRLCDRLIFVARSDMEFAVRRGLARPDRSEVVYNGIAPALPFLDRSEARDGLGFGAHEFVVGTVARLGFEKDIELFLHAAASDPTDTRYCVVGDGPDREWLAKLIREMGLSERVRIVPGLQDGFRYMSAFDVFMMTSRYEGLPYTLLEASQAGVPVVAADVGGVPEIVRDGETGLLVSGREPTDFAAAVARLRDDWRLAATISAGARHRTAEMFSESEMAASVLRTYRTSLCHDRT